MSVQLPVTQVRKEIYRISRMSKHEIDARPSNLLLGKVFHKAFALLYGNDTRFSWQSAISAADPNKEEWERLLEDHLYRRIVGPMLGREQVHLGNATEQVLTFWQAAKSMNRWVVGALMLTVWSLFPKK